jgi:hypothetical protein
MFGEIHGLHEAPFKLHWMLASELPPVSEAENVNVFETEDTNVAGEPETFNTGAVKSVVHE